MVLVSERMGGGKVGVLDEVCGGFQSSWGNSGVGCILELESVEKYSLKKC